MRKNSTWRKLAGSTRRARLWIRNRVNAKTHAGKIKGGVMPKKS